MRAGVLDRAQSAWIAARSDSACSIFLQDGFGRKLTFLAAAISRMGVLMGDHFKLPLIQA
jgi:uncharacterized protein YecT (DUF1311 family)